MALDDLELERIGLIVKLSPVIAELTKDRPKLRVALQVPTHEKLGIAFRKHNVQLCAAFNNVLLELRKNGKLDGLRTQCVAETVATRESSRFRTYPQGVW